MYYVTFTDNRLQSNLNEIDRFEHKSSVDALNKGFSWPTDHVDISFGKFEHFSYSNRFDTIDNFI